MPAVTTIKAQINEAHSNLKLARKIDDEVLIAFWTAQMDELLDQMIRPKPHPPARRPRRTKTT